MLETRIFLRFIQKNLQKFKKNTGGVAQKEKFTQKWPVGELFITGHHESLEGHHES